MSPAILNVVASGFAPGTVPGVISESPPRGGRGLKHEGADDAMIFWSVLKLRASRALVLDLGNNGLERKLSLSSLAQGPGAITMGDPMDATSSPQGQQVQISPMDPLSAAAPFADPTSQDPATLDPAPTLVQVPVGTAMVPVPVYINDPSSYPAGDGHSLPGFELDPGPLPLD